MIDLLQTRESLFFEVGFLNSSCRKFKFAFYQFEIYYMQQFLHVFDFRFFNIFLPSLNWCKLVPIQHESKKISE